MKFSAFKWAGIFLLIFGFIAIILTPLSKPPVKPVKVKKERLQKPLAVKGKIVIVIDDWGYHLNNLKTLSQIKQPLTCAVLPNLKYSKTLARELSARGCEIILHLPMEPKEKYNLEDNTLTTGMTDQAIRQIIQDDLSSVELAKGVSNHMGSQVSLDKRVAALVLEMVKSKGLYFLDSFVIKGSVFGDLAGQKGVRFAKRDIFLDNQKSFEHIRGQLLQLQKIAAKRGYAIGIGHDREDTLLALKKILPEMEKEGYKFIYLSQVAR